MWQQNEKQHLVYCCTVKKWCQDFIVEVPSPDVVRKTEKGPKQEHPQNALPRATTLAFRQASQASSIACLPPCRFICAKLHGPTVGADLCISSYAFFTSRDINVDSLPQMQWLNYCSKLVPLQSAQGSAEFDDLKANRDLSNHEQCAIRHSRGGGASQGERRKGGEAVRYFLSNCATKI